MRVTIDIDDDLYERIRKNAKANVDDRLKVNTEIKRILADFADVGKGGRYVILEGDLRRQMEKILQTTIDAPDRLVALVKNLSIFGIGDVQRPLTEDESIHLANQAHFWDQTPEEYLLNTLDRVFAETMDRV